MSRIFWLVLVACFSVVSVEAATKATKKSTMAETMKISYEDGLKAYIEEDFPVALKHFRPLAEKGDGRLLFKKFDLVDRAKAAAKFSFTSAVGAQRPLREADGIGRFEDFEGWNRCG